MRTALQNVAMMIHVLLLAGCSSLHTVPGPPRDVVRQIGSRNVVRLTDKRGHEVDLADVHVEGDSLVGVRSMASGERVALAIVDVGGVAVRDFDPVKTAFLTVGGVMTLLGIAFAVLGATFKGT